VTAKEWEVFFRLIDRVVHDLPGSASEKAETVRVHAGEENCGSELEEFASWFSSE
jgi:hypothetical protein